MSIRMATKLVVAILMLVFYGVSYAGNSCQSVEREMAYGTAALEGAKDKAGYLRSAKEFEAAIKKVPRCAAAHFNLGLVYEKAGKYKKALESLQSYLRLSPNASDATEVQNKIYKLEYRLKDAKRVKIETRRKEEDKRELEADKFVQDLSGKWLVGTLEQLSKYGTETIYDLSVTGKDSFKLVFRYTKERISTSIENFPEKSEYEFSVGGNNSISGTYNYWMDLSRMNCRIEERSFQVTGKISTDGNTITVSSQEMYQPFPSPCGWQRQEKFKRVFTRFH